MIHQRSAGIHYLHVACQIVLVIPIFWLLVRLVHYQYPEFISVFFDRYAIYNLCIVGGLIFSAAANPGLISNVVRRDFAAANQNAIRQLLFSTGFLLAVLVITKDLLISRIFLGVLVAVLYVFFLLTNRFLPRILAKIIFRRFRHERTVLFGTAHKAAQMHEWLRLKRDFGLDVVGLVTLEMPELEQGEFPVLGSADDLEPILLKEKISQVIVVEFPYFANMLAKLSDICERNAIRLLVVTDFKEKFSHSVDYFDDDGVRFITLRREPLESPFNRLLKRGFDLAIAILVCVTILPPLMVIVWIAQRLQSSGPLFHRQERAGIQNRPFRIFKFRTMHEGDHQLGQQATADDCRIYAFGKFLRRFSIDEVPQFLNVFFGEMSVVGPRPHLIEHNSEFATVMSNYHVRTFVKPGITGLAQVRGFRGEIRSEHDLLRRIQSDIDYVESWSVSMDLMIVTRTCWQVFLPPPNAY